MTLYAKDIPDRDDLTRVARHAIVDESGAEIVSDVVDEAWRERIIAAVNSSQPELRKALEFYASPFNWTSGRWTRGGDEDDEADEPVASLICIDRQFEEGGTIPFADCGDRARKALAAAPVNASRSGEDEPGEGWEPFLSDLEARSKWHADRHNVQDAIRLQRDAKLLRVAHGVIEQLHGPLSVAALTARAEAAEAALASAAPRPSELVAALREALEPFARLYDELMRDYSDGSAKPDRPDDQHAWGFNNVNLTWGDFRKARAALATPGLAASLPTAGVGVKAMEWTYDVHTSKWWANSAIGRYEAWEISGFAYFHLNLGRAQSAGKETTVEAAKVAAQADFEARIRSALTPIEGV